MAWNRMVLGYRNLKNKIAPDVLKFSTHVAHVALCDKRC